MKKWENALFAVVDMENNTLYSYLRAKEFCEFSEKLFLFHVAKKNLGTLGRSHTSKKKFLWQSSFPGRRLLS